MTGPTLTAAQQRQQFADAKADPLAAQVGAAAGARLRPQHGRTTRFVWYQDDSTLTLVAGAQEAKACDLALAIGLGTRGQRALRLVLPRGWHEPTLHRWAWLNDELPLHVWTHCDDTVTATQRPTREATLRSVEGGEEPALHLGDRTSWVEPLMRWAGEQPDLDPAHRRDVRAWQCRGQRVLRIHRIGGGLTVIAGIDWGANSAHASPVRLLLTGPLIVDQEQQIKDAVLAGCAQRLTGVAHKADEHWLQSVLRRHPRVLGLEQPVLRELPAWRPAGAFGSKQTVARGRGFVDLAGLDATGSLLLVETKLGGDDMLVMQGLDYLIWAEANRDRLTTRLDCSPGVPFEIAYCVGGRKGDTPTWSPHAAAQLATLASDVRWHVQEVTDWTGDDPRSTRGATRAFPLRADVTRENHANTTPPQTAELGTGIFSHELVCVFRHQHGDAGGWFLATALHRGPKGHIRYVNPWTEPFQPAGADLTAMWRYLSERVLEGRGGNGYTYEVIGLEVADPQHVESVARTLAHQWATVSGNDTGGADVAALASESVEEAPHETPTPRQPPHEAISWALAARLAAVVGDDYRLEEHHEGGDQYDQLSFVSDRRPDISLNRVGSVYVMTDEQVRVLPYEAWETLHDPTSMDRVVGRLVQAVEATGSPVSGADIIAVIAAALSLPRAADEGWRVRWCPDPTDGFADNPTAAYHDQDLRLHNQGWRNYWLLTAADGSAIAAFDLGGYIHRPGQGVVEPDLSYPDTPARKLAATLLGGTARLS